MPAWAFQTFEGRIAQKGSCGYRMCLTVVVLQETNRKPMCCSHCAFVTSERSCVEMLGSYREISRSMEFATEILWITSHWLPERSWVSISAVFVLRWIDVLSAVWRVFALHTDYESHKSRWSVWDQSTAECQCLCLYCLLALSSHASCSEEICFRLFTSSVFSFSFFLGSVHGIIQFIIIKNVYSNELIFNSLITKMTF